MNKITRQQLADNLDNILDKINKDKIGYIILNNNGNDSYVLCSNELFEVTSNHLDNNIQSIMSIIKNLKEETYNMVSEAIRKIRNGDIVDIEGIEDFKDLLMDYGDDYRFFELYKSLREVLKEKYPQLITGKWD